MLMYVIRPISSKDQEAFEHFAFSASIGLTNLPKNKERLKRKILMSEISFSKDISAPKDEIYLFVLEDIKTGNVVGTSGILSRVGYPHQAFFYQIETLQIDSDVAEVPKEQQILRVVPETTGSSEICSLYLLPEYRKGGLGKLLSLSRFLFIASFPKRFEKRIVAELRGKIDENGSAPFWEGLGRHFCQISFQELYARLDKNRNFISEILPDHPIYVSLLPQTAQEAIGQTFEHTKPALKMLQKEGFTQSSYIDLFDGGPLMEASAGNIRSIKNSRTASIELSNTEVFGEEALISNKNLDFRACMGKIHYISDHRVIIQKDVADALRLKKDDIIRYLPFSEES
jgi:arginine N-succinyltransferase